MPSPPPLSTITFPASSAINLLAPLPPTNSSRSPCQSIMSVNVEDFLHLSPPLTFVACGQRRLHRTHDRPPFLCLGMGSHLGPVLLQIRTVVFEIAEQHIVFAIDGVIPDVTFADHLQYFRPHGCVIALVQFFASRFQPDRHPKTLHFLSFPNDGELANDRGWRRRLKTPGAGTSQSVGQSK